jgi:PAS domain S-box-containing protein
MRDLSVKKSMAAALNESEERFRALAESSPDSITVYLLSKSRYVYANPKALKILGLASIADLETFDPWNSVEPERKDEVRERTAQMRRGETVPPFVIRKTDEEGKEILLEALGKQTSFGGEPALVTFTRDITERVRLQAELMKRDRLASVGMLAAGVAHELNNPLTALGLQARRLRDDADRHGLSADVRSALDQMNEAASRMHAIIADLLFMARPVDKPQAHVDVAQSIRSTIALLQAGETSVPPIHVDLDGLPSIEGWASKLGQVFFNVLRNALEAAGAQESGEVHVRGRAEAESVEIVIADNGPGVPADFLPRVAHPFATTKPNGTGLGLWISQALVTEHGGTLDLSSTEGAGTTVVIRLPMRLSAA